MRYASKAIKRATYAEAYGAGDVAVGQITGQYPNPSYVQPVLDTARRHLELWMEDTLYRAIQGRPRW